MSVLAHIGLCFVWFGVGWFCARAYYLLGYRIGFEEADGD